MQFKRDTRRPYPFGEPFGWNLAVTSDLVHYEDKGTALPRGTDEEQDQFIFAGSVFETEEISHFYTGFNRDYPKLGKAFHVLSFYENEETSQSYQYLFNIEENRYRFEMSPNMPWSANQNIGLRRPIRLEAGKKYHSQMILDDTIATIYVDGVALNTRFYQRFGQFLSLFVTDGTLTVTNAGQSKTIK